MDLTLTSWKLELAWLAQLLLPRQTSVRRFDKASYFQTSCVLLLLLDTTYVQLLLQLQQAAINIGMGLLLVLA